MSEMIRLHEQDLAAFERMQTSARSSEVRELARSGVPTIREHLTLARQVGSRVGVSTTAARTGGVTSPTPAPFDSAARDARDDRNPRPLGAEDRAFVEDILSDHLLHIRLARRAQREARKDETRELAKRIENDFTHWEARWQRVAARHDADLESRLERVDRRKIDRLEDATKRGFDRTYGAIVAERLESLLRDFRKVGEESESAAVRRLVEEEIPVIREDLQRARRLHEQATK
jgi:predicted outer membrane protein